MHYNVYNFIRNTIRRVVNKLVKLHLGSRKWSTYFEFHTKSNQVQSATTSTLNSNEIVE